MTYSGVTLIVLVSFGVLAWTTSQALRGVATPGMFRQLGITGTRGWAGRKAQTLRRGSLPLPRVKDEGQAEILHQAFERRAFDRDRKAYYEQAGLSDARPLLPPETDPCPDPVPHSAAARQTSRAALPQIVQDEKQSPMGHTHRGLLATLAGSIAPLSRRLRIYLRVCFSIPM
jgi:hypothetical protein